MAVVGENQMAVDTQRRFSLTRPKPGRLGQASAPLGDTRTHRAARARGRGQRFAVRHPTSAKTGPSAPRQPANCARGSQSRPPGPEHRVSSGQCQGEPKAAEPPSALGSRRGTVAAPAIASQSSKRQCARRLADDTRRGCSAQQPLASGRRPGLTTENRDSRSVVERSHALRATA